MRLYEMTAEYERLLSIAEDGDDSDALVQLLDQQLDAIEAKGAAIAQLLATLDAEAAAVKVEEQRLNSTRKRLERNADRMREYLRANMAACGIRRIKSTAFSISLSDGPHRVVVLDERAIPAEYMRERVTREPDKTAILGAYTAEGVCVPGTEVVRSTCLRIR